MPYGNAGIRTEYENNFARRFVADNVQKMEISGKPDPISKAFIRFASVDICKIIIRIFSLLIILIIPVFQGEPQVRNSPVLFKKKVGMDFAALFTLCWAVI